MKLWQQSLYNFVNQSRCVLSAIWQLIFLNNTLEMFAIIIPLPVLTSHINTMCWGRLHHLSLFLNSLSSRGAWLSYSWFATMWQGGHIEGQYNRIFSRRIYMREERTWPTWPPWRHVQTSNCRWSKPSDLKVTAEYPSTSKLHIEELEKWTRSYSFYTLFYFQWLCKRQVDFVCASYCYDVQSGYAVAQWLRIHVSPHLGERIWIQVPAPSCNSQRKQPWRPWKQSHSAIWRNTDPISQGTLKALCYGCPVHFLIIALNCASLIILYGT